MIETRYCGGFPKRRTPKRFSSSDPKVKAPKWCPRRIWPPIYRVYGFVNEQSRDMNVFTMEHFDPKKDRYISVFPWHYRMRLETSMPMRAKDFFGAAKCGDTEDFFEETDLQQGEIIEVDDGLTPYYFYFWGWSKLIPVFSFDCSKIQKDEK